MKITTIIWLDEVIEKIESKHRVATKDVEQVLGNEPEVNKDAQRSFSR